MLQVRRTGGSQPFGSYTDCAYLLVRPSVGRMPTSAVCEAGPLTELPVSVPRPTRAKLAATPARASLLTGSGICFMKHMKDVCSTYATHLQHIQFKRGCAGTVSSCRDVVSSSNRATAVKRQAAQRLPCSGENKNAKHILVRNDRVVESYLDAFEKRGIGALYLKQAGSAGPV